MKHGKTLAFLAVLGAGTALGFGMRSVPADGIPTPNPLYYSGTLTEGGSPVNGSRQITVNLWINGTAQIGEKAICTATTATTPVVNGRFRIALDSSCKGAINANPNVFVEVDGTTSLGRAAIGAVPYAVEADHAVNATTAATANVGGGTLATTIAGLQAQAHTASAFHAYQVAAISIPYAALHTVAFDTWNTI